MNAVSFDFDSGSLLASVSDDNKCILWCTQDASKQAEFRLKSAGMDVKFNQQDNTKVGGHSKHLLPSYDLAHSTQSIINKNLVMSQSSMLVDECVRA